MAEAKGNWFKLYRSLADWEYYKDGNTVRVFLDLMIRAELKPREYKGVTIDRGQVVTTLDEIGARLGLSKKQVRGTLEDLQRARSVALKRYPRFLVISIVSWDKYQPEGHDKGHDKGTIQGTERARSGHGKGIPYILNEERKKKEAAAPHFSPSGDLKGKKREVDKDGYVIG